MRECNLRSGRSSLCACVCACRYLSSRHPNLRIRYWWVPPGTFLPDVTCILTLEQCGVVGKAALVKAEAGENLCADQTLESTKERRVTSRSDSIQREATSNQYAFHGL